MIDSRWCGTSPEYRTFLAEAIVPDTVDLEGVRVPGVDARALVDLGAGDRARPADGKLILTVFLNPMIAMGRFEDLRTWLLQVPDVTKERDTAHLYRFCVEHNLDAAREEIEEAHKRELGLGPALLLYSGYGMVEMALQYLREVTARAQDVFLLGECARTWKIIFDDEEEARRTLARAEKAIATRRRNCRPHIPSAWSVLAETWKGNLADEAEAARCLREAERKSRDSYDWCICAELRHAYFGDVETARRWLLRARKRVSAYSWHRIDCARGWMSVLHDPQEAERCLRSGEAIATDFLDWGQCAGGWKEIVGDLAHVHRCLELSEDKATTSGDWAYCASGWEELAGDSVRARRCLETANRTATRCIDWWCLASDWTQILRDQKEGRCCMEKAETLATTSWDWSICAGTWKRHFSDDAAARRCMERAEGLSATPRSWCDCAKTWMDDFDDEGQARRCMAEAEALAIGAEDWNQCAETWDALEDKTGERRCRRRERRARLKLVGPAKPSPESGRPPSPAGHR
jgi:hypothetical protein